MDVDSPAAEAAPEPEAAAAHALTDAERVAYAQDGYFVRRGVFSAEELAAASPSVDVSSLAKHVLTRVALRLALPAAPPGAQSARARGGGGTFLQRGRSRPAALAPPPS